MKRCVRAALRSVGCAHVCLSDRARGFKLIWRRVRASCAPACGGILRPRQTPCVQTVPYVIYFSAHKMRPDIAGWSSLVARRAHNPEVVGSNPAPATKNTKVIGSIRWPFSCCGNGFSPLWQCCGSEPWQTEDIRQREAWLALRRAAPQACSKRRPSRRRLPAGSDCTSCT